jgi:hypothetical protein
MKFNEVVKMVTGLENAKNNADFVKSVLNADFNSNATITLYRIVDGDLVRFELPVRVFDREQLCIFKDAILEYVKTIPRQSEKLQ